MSNPDPIGFSVALDMQHHDRPERHYFGQSLGVPIAPPVGSGVASAGVSDTPAREDHVHGLTAVNAGLSGTLPIDLTGAKYIQGGAATLTSDSGGNLTLNYPTAFPVQTTGFSFSCASSSSILNSGLLIATTVNRFGATIALRNSSTGANPGAGISVGIRWIATGS